jgi:hypothetical protein
MVAYPDPNAVGREAACAQALRNLMDFALDRFPVLENCNCDFCQDMRYAKSALMSSGYGERGLVDG